MRGTGKDNERIASEADRLLSDPAFQRAYDMIREGYVKALEEAKSDGSPEFEDYVIDIARSLRNLNALRRTLSLTVQRQQFTMAALVTEAVEGSVNATRN